MRELNARLTALSPAKRALLERMAGLRPDAGIPRIAEGPAPLSAEQRRLWYLLQLAAGRPVYVIPLGFRLRGELDHAALLGALSDLVDRHEGLRTAFRESAGEPVQEVTDGEAFSPEVLDLRGDTWAEPEANYQTDAFVRRPFRLDAGETFRAMLIREGDTEHRLLLALHHLAGDGAGAATLLAELGVLYAARRGGAPAALPAGRVRFRDWAAWQQTREPDREGEAHWRRELEGARPLLDLPTDHPRPERQSWEGARHGWDLPPHLAERVSALARREGTTPYVVAAAAFALLLSRYSGEEDLLVGTVLANRPRPEMDGVVGFFANTLPLRARLDGDPSVGELLRRVHRAAAAAQAHGGVPFDRIVELAGIRRDYRRPPLVQAVLVYNDGAAASLRLPGVEAEPLAMESGTSIFELTLLIEQRAAGLHATLQYSTALWEPESAARMAGHLERVLEAFTDGPERRLSTISLAAAEEVTALEGWSSGGPPALEGTCLHELFRAQARATPHAPALAWQDRTLSYAELDAVSDRAAAALRLRGVGPETRVGVRMSRTPELIAALLGVLKSGGAYVPLDPEHPASRHAAVLRGAGAALVIVDGTPGALPEGVEAVPFASLDADPEPGPVPVTPANLAYVLFTSGSTGGPKGVEIEHRSAAAVVGWMREALSPRERSVVLGSTPLTFDVSVGEIFGTLSWGGTLVLTEGILSPVPADRGVRSAAMTPTAAAELLEGGRFPRVEAVLLGGEAVPQRLVDALHGLSSVKRVLNLYGPTEDTVYTTCAELEAGAERVSLGRPVAGGVVRVLDPALRPAGIGVPGEGWTTGAGIARGYAGRPSLTAERFVPDPHGPPGSRMYRTLDRLRWVEDGTLEYLGRADAQVKLRGYRIELGEVEGALASHPAVAAAAAAVRGEGVEQRLVGYLAARPGSQRPEPSALRAWLRERLPEYMVPGAWVWLEALPRTTSGKVDRRALPEPPASGELREERVAPRDDLERRLVDLWRDVLGVDGIGVTDDFFDLGGQSILATRLVARVRTELDAELPVAELLQAPTVEAMARAIQARQQRVRPPLVPLQILGDRRPLFLAHPAGGHVVCYRGLAVLLAPEQPVYALQPRGVEDGLVPLDDIREMAAHYLAAIRRMQPAGPYRLAGWSFGGVVAWEMAHQLVAAGAPVEMVALLDTAPVGDGGLHVDPRDTPDVVWSTVAGLAGFAAASRVDVATLRGLEVREAALAMIRGIRSPRILDESRVDDVVALTRVRSANLRAQLEYAPPPVPVHLTYFRTAGSALTDELAGAVDFWSALALGGTTVHPVSGSHGLILTEPHVHAVVDAVLALG